MAIQAEARAQTVEHPPLDVKGLSVTFPAHGGAIRVVHDVSFHAAPGEFVGLVGESGSGKSVSGLAVMGLLPREARVAGTINIAGRNVATMSPNDQQRMRGSEVSMIFQEPMTALNPVFTIGAQIVATIRAHHRVGRRVAQREAVDLLDSVGISDPARIAREYPHRLSGGMRQRALIAMAIACGPRVLIADEPTTALDVTIQAQIMNLLRGLCADREMAVLLITHDLGLVAEQCTRVFTMYSGEIVETGETANVLAEPAHPYTAGLIRSAPSGKRSAARLYSIPGQVPSPTEQILGCRFHPRCEFATADCAQMAQELRIANNGRLVRCMRVDDPELRRAIDLQSEFGARTRQRSSTT